MPITIGSMNTDPDSGFGKLTTAELGGNGAISGEVENGKTYNGALRWETPLRGLKLGYTLTHEEMIDNPDNDFSEDKWYYGAVKMSFNF